MEHFATQWADGWNSHDLDKILAHYTDDVEMTSPYMIQVIGKGTLQGKEPLREYWRKGLNNNPGLKFEILDVAYRVDMLSIYYHSMTAKKNVIESFWFRDGLVFKCNSAYTATK